MMVQCTGEEFLSHGVALSRLPVKLVVLETLPVFQTRDDRMNMRVECWMNCGDSRAVKYYSYIERDSGIEKITQGRLAYDLLKQLFPAIAFIMPASGAR